LYEQLNQSKRIKEPRKSFIATKRVTRSVGGSTAHQKLFEDTNRISKDEDPSIFEYYKDRKVTVSAPFTILSTQTTIWNLGEINVQGNSEYFSSAGCIYKHPYPVGYFASKYHFGYEFSMWISKNNNGPVFHVLCEDGCHFQGTTPTKPWTDVCLHFQSKVGKTRLSGPLLYGFSDPVVITGIEQLDNFALVGGKRSTFRKAPALTQFSTRKRLANCRFLRDNHQIDIETPSFLGQFWNIIELSANP
jgi:hypothetical protein